MCLVHHSSDQKIIQISYLNQNTQRFQKVQNWAENNQCKLIFLKEKKTKGLLNSYIYINHTSHLRYLDCKKKK